MKTKEEIEQLAQNIHYDMSQEGLDANGCFNQYQGFIKGYTQCQVDNMEKRYTEVDMRRAMKYASEITNNKMKYMEDYINSLNKQD
jgi:hypothetical protein